MCGDVSTRRKKKKNKLDFFSCVQLQCNQDNDKLEDTEGLVVNNAHDDIVAQFPGIKLEQEMVGGTTAAMTEIDISVEQEVFETEANNGLIEPTI